MALAHVTDHQARAVGRLAEQYKASASIVELVSLATAEHQTLEDELWAVFGDTDIDAASSASLRILADIIGQPYDATWTDARLRTWIRVRRKLNQSSGTIPEIQEMASLLVPGGVKVKVDESYPCQITVTLGGGAEVIDPTDAGAIVLAARAAGVSAVTVSPVTSDANAFTLDDATAPSPLTTQALSDTTQVTGGALGTVI